MDWSLVDCFVLDKMSEYRMPGLSLAVVKGGEVIYSRGYGYRNLESMIPATPGTVYGIGSITKSFTALAVMMLHEDGFLDLHDPVAKYGVDLRVLGEPVTIHHLLTHSSGIPALAYAEAFLMSSFGSELKWLPTSYPEDVIAFMKGYEEWVDVKPGTKFYYLNEGYVVLGKIVEKVSGVKYEEYIKEKILKPLGMSRTYFSREEVKRDDDVATGYIIDREGKHVPKEFPYGVTADGGLLSNPLDMVKYINMYLGWGRCGNVELVARKSVEVMEAPHIRLPYESLTADHYGYGLMVKQDFHGRRLVGHGGSVGNYTAYIGYVRGDGIGVAIATNASGYPLSLLGQYILTYALGLDPEGLGFRKVERVLSKLTGTYETFKGAMRLVVRGKQPALVVEQRDKYVEEITPLTPQVIDEDYALFYVHTLTGRVPVEFRIKENRVEMLYERYKLVKVGP